MKWHAMGAQLRRTKADFEELLNRKSPAPDSIKWIIGGKQRRPNGNYGTLLRKNSAQLFNAAYKEWSKFKLTK